jgi:hypothetical protein
MLHSLADGGEGVERWLEFPAPGEGDICWLSRCRSLLVTTETCDIKRPHRRQCRRSGSSWFAFWFVTSTVSHVQIAPLYFRNIAVCGKQAPYVRCRKYLKWGWNLKLALDEVQLPNAAKISVRYGKERRQNNIWCSSKATDLVLGRKLLTTGFNAALDRRAQAWLHMEVDSIKFPQRSNREGV